MSGALSEHFNVLLADQERRLKEIREDRRNLYRRISEIDSEEIDVILSIQRLKDVIENEGER